LKRGKRRIVFIDRVHFFGRHDYGAEITVSSIVLESGSALLALKQQLHSAESALNLSDSRNDPHGVQYVRSGLVSIVALRNGKYESVALEGRLDGAKSSGPARRNRRGESRKDYCSAKWQNGYSLTLSHVFP
jgi:hypothetical protein